MPPVAVPPEPVTAVTADNLALVFKQVGVHLPEGEIKRRLAVLAAVPADEVDAAKLTVKQLAAELKKFDLKRIGIKSELVARLQSARKPEIGGIKFSRELLRYAWETMA